MNKMNILLFVPKPCKITHIMKTSTFLFSLSLAFSQTCFAQDVETWFRTVMQGTPQQVEALIAAGADVNAKNDRGVNALMGIASSEEIWRAEDDAEYLRLMLTENTDAKMPPDEVKNFVMVKALLIKNQYIEIAKLLLAAGADVNAKENNGGTALMMATWTGQVELIEMLLAAGADVNAQSDGGHTALMTVALMGNEKVLEILLAAGADVNIKNDEEDTAFYFAISRGNVRTIELLLAAGVDVNAKYKYGRTALMNYITPFRHKKEESLDVIKLLIDAGADVNAKDDNGETVLMLAIYTDKLGMIKFLLDNGADPNYILPVKDFIGGVNVLMDTRKKMILSNHAEIIQLLLDAGAEDNKEPQFLVDEFKRVVQEDFYLAAKQGKLKTLAGMIVDGMVDKATITKALDHAMSNENPDNEVVKFLQDFSANTKEKDDDEITLQQAVKMRNVETVKILCDAGADPNAKYENDLSVLMQASLDGQFEIVKTFLDSGADVNYKDGGNFTALILAMITPKIEVVKLLLDAGADIHVKTIHGQTARDYAILQKADDIVVLLDTFDKTTTEKK